MAYRRCFPSPPPRFGTICRGNCLDKLSCRIPIIKLPTAENGIIFNEVIIAHAVPKSGPARDVNLFPSEEKVVEEAALVLS